MTSSYHVISELFLIILHFIKCCTIINNCKTIPEHFVFTENMHCVVLSYEGYSLISLEHLRLKFLYQFLKTIMFYLFMPIWVLVKFTLALITFACILLPPLCFFILSLKMFVLTVLDWGYSRTSRLHTNGRTVVYGSNVWSRPA